MPKLWKEMRRPLIAAVLAYALIGHLTGCASVRNVEAERPEWLTVVSVKKMDGRSDDLLTAGMGMGPLLGESPGPTYADSLQPSASELRRAAIYSLGGSAAGGFGRLFGPNIDPVTRVQVADARIAGEEVLAFTRDAGVNHVSSALLLQIPSGFEPKSPCILAVPTTGSSRIYTDLLRVGGWGLRRNCAVVYTDKGQGNGVHDLASDTVNLVDGRRADAQAAGAASHFTAPMSQDTQEAYLRQYPNRVAFKHAHSRQNPDASWGREVLRSIQFAFYELNIRYAATGQALTRANTLVIATGNSNGGAAALLGGEADRDGWIDGIVAAQPAIQPQSSDDVAIERLGREWRGGGRALLDHVTETILYQPCAAMATPAAWRTDEVIHGGNRCTSLKEKGLLRGATLAEQAREARQHLHDMGFEPDGDDQNAHHFLIAPAATANKYANSLGRFGIEDGLCGYSTGPMDAQGRPMAASAQALAAIFVTAPGGVPAGPIDLINDRDPRGPVHDMLSISPSTGRQDYNLDGSLCLRSLVTGDTAQARRVQAGIAQVRANGDLHGKPALVLHGREDARVPATFTSRPYAGLNSLREGPRAQLRYIEITHISHFGAPGKFDAKYVPLAYYEEQALNLMWDHLSHGEPLPPSQLVRTVSRGGEPGKAPPLQIGNLPAISEAPKPADRIQVSAGRVVLPD